MDCTKLSIVLNQNETNKYAKDWFIFLLPNLKHLILGVGDLPQIDSELIPILNNKMQQLDIEIFFMKSDYKKLIKQVMFIFQLLNI